MKKPTHVVWKAIDPTTAILLDLQSGRYYSLNETAMSAWTLLESGVPVEQTVERMAAAYRTDAGEIDQDVGALINMLIDNGLLESGDATHGHDKTSTKSAALSAQTSYQRPMVTIHDAIEQVTAGSSSGGSGGSYSYSYYYYYYY